MKHGCIWFALATAIAPALAQERFTPQAHEVVLAHSIYGQDASSQSLKQLEQAWRAQPQNEATALAYARSAFNRGLQSGDLRWFGNAKSALMPWWSSHPLSAEGFYLRGLIQQGFHAFQAGLDDINQAIALEPGRDEFWSWRFVLHLLLTQLTEAQADLKHMQGLIGSEETSIYRAMYDYRTGHAQRAVQGLRQALTLPRFQNASSQEWVGYHLGEALRLSGQTGAALTVWQQQLKAQPQSHWLRLTLVTQLNVLGRYQQALDTAVQRQPLESLSDALLVQALLAQKGLGLAQADLTQTLVVNRQQASAQRQDGLIERPTLVFLIQAGADPTQGLALAARNWQTQQDPPDAQLLVQAALLTNQPMAAKPVWQWVAQTGYLDPQLTPLLKQLQAHPDWRPSP